jgi:hypothetical protein
MTVEPREGAVAEGVRSLEVRWIFLGQLAAAVAGWFGRFPTGMESREDIYLLDPPLPGLSVKVRGGGALEVKAYRGSPGILDLAGLARRMSRVPWNFGGGPFDRQAAFTVSSLQAAPTFPLKCASSAARSFGRCRWPLTRRNW